MVGPKSSIATRKEMKVPKKPLASWMILVARIRVPICISSDFDRISLLLCNNFDDSRARVQNNPRPLGPRRSNSSSSPLGWLRKPGGIATLQVADPIGQQGQHFRPSACVEPEGLEGFRAQFRPSR